MKKVLSTFLAAVMLTTAMAGCGAGGSTPGSGSTGSSAGSVGSSGASGEIKIGHSLSSRDQFLTSMETAATNEAKELGVKIDLFDANNDIATQLSHVQTCEVKGYDAMIVNLVSTDNAAEIVQAAGDMKVIFVNRRPDDSVLKDGEVVYVGSDENFSGKFQGDYLAEYFKAQGKTDINAVLFQGVLGLDAVIKRTDSVKKSLKDNGINVTYIYEDTAEWDRAKAMEKMIQFMGSGKPYDVVICNNDEMALGVIEAMKTTGSGEIPVPVVGIDATSVGCQAVKSGEMACSVFQSAEGQGAGSVKTAVSLAKGEKPEGMTEDNIVWVPFELVTKDNVDQYMK